jgi:glycosyltransferase involved in cell wall biosynthesis
MTETSVLVLTLNEEANLGACLESCAWCDDIVVFDSLSSDQTVAIARAHGARVIQRPFDNYAAQRNAALQNVEYKHSWVLMLDADERVTAELVNEMQSVLSRAGDDTTMFRMRRRDWFFGRWLRRSSGYPTWFGRLVRPNRVRVEREINEEYVTDGNICLLQEHLDHFPFNKGLAWWFERHNRYSTMEATALLDERAKAIPWRDLFKDAVLRRRAMKRIMYRLPGRPLISFVYLYIVRLGFLDGLPGFYFSCMRSCYELMIGLKVRELEQAAVAKGACSSASPENRLSPTPARKERDD